MIRTRGRENRKGQTLILFSMSVVVLCCVLALTVDVGNLCASEARLQNAADAAALAALLELWSQRAAGADEYTARAAAVTEAQEVVLANYEGAGTDVAFGEWNTSFSALGPGAPASAVTVRAYRDSGASGGAVGTFFGRFINVDSVDQSASATARFKHKKLIPFSIYEGSVPAPGGAVTLYDNATVAPGVFGLLDFDGGANSSDDMKKWVEYGYEGPFYIDPTAGSLVVEGNTGFVASIDAGVNGHIAAGTPVVACVYRTVWGGGEGTYFEVVGFVTLILTAEGNTKVDGVPTKYIEGVVVSKYLPGNGTTQGSLRDIMHLRLMD